MSYFGVYIPPSKTGFEGNIEQCAGSIAAINIKPASETKDFTNEVQYEDPDYPPDSPLWLIFTEKSKALDVLRHYKEARLREFPNREQAESYVQFGFESIRSLKRFGKCKPLSKPVQSPSTVAPTLKATVPTDAVPIPTIIGSLPKAPYNSAIANLLSSSPTSNGGGFATRLGLNSGSPSGREVPLNAERPPFRAPTKQELVDFRKQIEAGNHERVRRIVWDNPRFLISSGDTPTSLKEGYRYNAMHICAQSNQARIAELILKTISDHEFSQLYAGKKGSDEMCATLNENLLDYYLNIPDKGRGETPLHFAVKNGHVHVVEVLTSYPQCKSLPNKDGQLPKDIICDRAPHTDPDVARKIEVLLKDPYYVPVLRTVDNELPPQVGQPFTPNELPNFLYKTDESDRLCVDLSISALAGPMPRDQAVNFYRRWKTPPRIGTNTTSPLAVSAFMSPIKTPTKSIFIKSNASNTTSGGRRILFSPLVAATPVKSSSAEEQNGNHKDLLQKANESSDSQTTAVDGLQLEIENNNNKQATSCVEFTYHNALHMRHALELPATPIRQMKPELYDTYRCNKQSSLMDDFSMHGTPSSNVSMDLSLNASVSTLNDSFRERHIKNSDVEKGLEVVGRQLARHDHLEWREYWDFLEAFVDIASPAGLAQFETYLSDKSEQAWNFVQMHHYLELVDRGKAPNNVAASTPPSTSGAIEFVPITQVITPYTCVEKSLQVFAKRITKTLMNNIGNLVSINDTLLSELKRLKSLIISFKDDARFICVDFSKVHLRIAHLVASYVEQSQEVGAIKLQLLAMLRELLELHGERREHLHCVCVSMLEMLDKPPAVQLPDALKTEELCLAAWEAEQCCDCQWEGKPNRKTSRRKRTESLRASLATNMRPSASAPHFSRKDAWRNNNVSDDDSDDDVFYFDCSFDGDSDSADEEGVFMTPPESFSPLSMCNDMEPSYELFIFGKEPTKRDLDVLNAIFHIEIDKENYPYTHAWKAAMESFSTVEMELFPSPKTVKQTHKPFFTLGTSKLASNSISSPSKTSLTTDITSLVMPKRLFASPLPNATAPRRCALMQATPPKPTYTPRPPLPSTSPQNTQQQIDSTHEKPPPPSASVGTPAPAPANAVGTTVSQTFITPLNKMRGLFSRYRDPHRDSSLTATADGKKLSLDDSD